jgi:hypothetical protein
VKRRSPNRRAEITLPKSPRPNHGEGDARSGTSRERDRYRGLSQEEIPMRIALLTAAAAIAALGLAACESKKDAAAEQQADALEQQAAATSNEAQETNLNAQADQVEQQAGNADSGATTGNTPNTSPSDPNAPAH